MVRYRQSIDLVVLRYDVECLDVLDHDEAVVDDTDCMMNDVGRIAVKCQSGWCTQEVVDLVEDVADSTQPPLVCRSLPW